MRAGPFQRCATSRACRGCSQVIQDSIGSWQAASRSEVRISSSDSRAYCAAGLGSTWNLPGVGAGTGVTRAGQARSSALTRRCTWGRSSRAPRRVRSRGRSRSPHTTTRPSRAAKLWRPAKASSGTTSVGANPSSTRMVSTAAVCERSLSTTSSCGSCPRQRRSPSIRGSRQFFTSMTNTPPGPTSSTSMLARADPGHARSASTCQPTSSMSTRTRTTPASPSPPGTPPAVAVAQLPQQLVQSEQLALERRDLQLVLVGVGIRRPPGISQRLLRTRVHRCSVPHGDGIVEQGAALERPIRVDRLRFRQIVVGYFGAGSGRTRVPTAARARRPRGWSSLRTELGASPAWPARA